jgi:hypothetical protein
MGEGSCAPGGPVVMVGPFCTAPLASNLRTVTCSSSSSSSQTGGHHVSLATPSSSQANMAPMHSCTLQLIKTQRGGPLRAALRRSQQFCVFITNTDLLQLSVCRSAHTLHPVIGCEDMLVKVSVQPSVCPSNTTTTAAFFSKSAPTEPPLAPPAAAAPAGGGEYTAADDQLLPLLPGGGPVLLLLLVVVVVVGFVNAERSSSEGRVICTSGP